jgi:hypothetical protein
MRKATVPYNSKTPFLLTVGAPLRGDGRRLGRIVVVGRKIRLERMSAWQRYRYNDSAAAYLVKNDPNHQAAARAACYVFAVAHVCYGYFEAVTAGTRVVVDLEGLVVEAVLNLYLVIQVYVFVGHGVGLYTTRTCVCVCEGTMSGGWRKPNFSPQDFRPRLNTLGGHPSTRVTPHVHALQYNHTSYDYSRPSTSVSPTRTALNVVVL